MMDIRDIQFLQAVAETGSITRAAERLGCVQSNVTTRIRKLEDRLGQKLVARVDGRMVPTAAGSLALDYGARIVSLSTEVEARLRASAQDWPPLRLGTMETTAAVRLPPVLKRIRDTLSPLRLTLKTGTSGELMAGLRRGAFDLVFVAEDVGDDRFASAPLWSERLVEVVPNNGAEPESAAIVFREGCCYRERCREVLGDLPMLELGTLDGIIGCVAAGLGRTLLPEAAVERWRAVGEIETRPIAGPDVRTLAVWHASSPSLRSIDAVVALALA
ncbi:LysR family transcriptional regulator [Xanthobacter autotrophicus]|uniref:LysR family transcriptional regulator n=1 Tax=Xanthobacter autotrophicus TaxID=280 RepID=UPI0024A71571|nr:LysR family transcriptional regulator [Xanthobacter autotrophicus]MDI4657282.1 LysR family transcriptional regulator [Xanthobacter autotrophicus]